MILTNNKVKTTGVRGVFIMAENAWRLDELWDQWLDKKKAAADFSTAALVEAS